MSILALKQAPDFDRFDRLAFITNQANALSGLLLDAQKSLAIPIFRESRFLAPERSTIKMRLMPVFLSNQPTTVLRRNELPWAIDYSSTLCYRVMENGPVLPVINLIGVLRTGSQRVLPQQPAGNASTEMLLPC
jgi:hypothetical protein